MTLQNGSRKPTTRTRRSTTKSRQGCGRCKAKRIKCDETHPRCRNCTDHGHACPGFTQSLRWSNKHERFDVPSLAVSSSDHAAGPSEPATVRHAPSICVGKEPAILNGPANSTIARTRSVRDTESMTPWPNSSPQTVRDAAASETGEAVDFISNHDIFDTYQLPPSLTHLPTALIQHWFREVCPTWSVFDSDVNYNRTVAQSSWGSSESVFLSLQAMSAAFLQSTLPEFVATSTTIAEEAATIVRSKAQAMLIRGATSPRITQDVVFAVFALGTAFQWNHPAKADNPWLKMARDLLSVWPCDLSGADHLYHSYLSQAFTYWDSLSTLMKHDSVPESLKRRRARLQLRLHEALNFPVTELTNIVPDPLLFTPMGGTRPNSWCGVSCEIINVLAETIALCRGADKFKQRKPSLSMSSTSKAVVDVALRHEIETEILAMDFRAIIIMEESLGFSVHTWDDQTPITHLLQTAEAYRQAALIQLHLSFDDSTSDAYYEKATTDASKLIELLEQIPVQSRSTSIHSILYLTAAAGLFNVQPSAAMSLGSVWQEGVDNSSTSSSEPVGRFHSLESPMELRQRSQQSQHHNNEPSHPSRSLAQTVAKARHSIWARLVEIQRTRPLRVHRELLQLIQRIWREYDKPRSGSCPVSWLRVWSESGLKTIIS
ncbi:hypothetical protein CC79DRAFT_1402305 [Sarocladium strictum]